MNDGIMHSNVGSAAMCHLQLIQWYLMHVHCSKGTPTTIGASRGHATAEQTLGGVVT